MTHWIRPTRAHVATAEVDVEATVRCACGEVLELAAETSAIGGAAAAAARCGCGQGLRVVAVVQVLDE